MDMKTGDTNRFEQVATGWDKNPARSRSLHKNAYIDEVWLEVERLPNNWEDIAL